MSNKNKNKDKTSSNSILESSFANDLKNQLATKHKIQERKDVDKNEIALKEKSIKEPEKVTTTKNNAEKISKVDETLKKEATDLKTVWKRILFGLSFGLTSVVPTLSKSSINGNFNLYYDFKDKLYGFFRPNGFKNWLYYLLWLLPVFIFAIPMFALMFFVVYKIADAGYGPSLMIGFIGIGIVSAIVYYFTNNVKMPFRKKMFDELVEKDKRPVIYIITFVVCVLVVLVFVLVSRFAWNDNPGLSWLGFNNEVNKPKIEEFQTSMAFLLIAAGFFAGFASLTPGLSSGIMLAMFGCFSKTVYATEVSFGANISIEQIAGQEPMDPQGWSWPILIVILVGYALGLVSNIFFEKWSSEKFPEAKKVAIFAFMISTPLLSLVSISSADYKLLSESGARIGVAIGLFIALTAVGIAIFFISHYFGFINIHNKIKTHQRKQVNLEK